MSSAQRGVSSCSASGIPSYHARRMPAVVLHSSRHDQARHRSERGDDEDRGLFVDGIRDDADDDTAHGVAEVAPEAIDADGGRAPGGVGAVADRGDECGIDQRGADPYGQCTQDPQGIRVDDGEAGDAYGLNREASDDERLEPMRSDQAPVPSWARPQLPG